MAGSVSQTGELHRLLTCVVVKLPFPFALAQASHKGSQKITVSYFWSTCKQCLVIVDIKASLVGAVAKPW